MYQGNCRRASGGCVIAAAVLLVASISACKPSNTSAASSDPAPSQPKTQKPPPAQASLIFVNANVLTMNPKQPVAQAVAVNNGSIVKVGSNEEVLALAGHGTQVFDVPGHTLLPGFIDPHSHMSGFGFYNDPDNWLDISSVNVFFKPSAADSRCVAPEDPQQCFIPVQSHDDVIARIKARVALWRTLKRTDPLMAFNYDPSRLGHSASCPNLNAVSFQCPNFENGTARAQLDAIDNVTPIYITSESGHISYVNTPALALLNICGAGSDAQATTDQPGCHEPTTNPDHEKKLARLGQLDEDLSLYATGYFQGELLKLPQNKGLGARLLRRAAETYAQHGYTLAQEGAAPLGLMLLYYEQLHDQTNNDFPVAAALVAYDANAKEFSKTIDAGREARKLIGDNNPLLSVAALKSFTDGSPQGYTADLSQPYQQIYPPFSDRAIFPEQPYSGLPDIREPEIVQRLRDSHTAGFPMVIHQIGDAAIQNAVNALKLTRDLPPPKGHRDLVLHAPMITAQNLDDVKALGTVVVSEMASNVYFFALPECQQVLGPERTRNIYPSHEVLKRMGRLTLHSDSPVTPPYPLFEIWTAVTRQAQQPSWYPNLDKKNCPTVMGEDQRISIEEGLRAFTVDAAYQYGMENIRGSIEPGKYADFVLLSADPLSPAVVAEPKKLADIRVIGTTRYGRYFPNPLANQKPVWPD